MLSILSLRKIDTKNTADLTDAELESIKVSLYELGQLIFEDWYEQKNSSKSPVGSLTEVDNKDII